MLLQCNDRNIYINHLICVNVALKPNTLPVSRRHPNGIPCSRLLLYSCISIDKTSSESTFNLHSKNKRIDKGEEAIFIKWDSSIPVHVPKVKPKIHQYKGHLKFPYTNLVLHPIILHSPFKHQLPLRFPTCWKFSTGSLAIESTGCCIDVNCLNVSTTDSFHRMWIQAFILYKGGY